MRHSRLDVKGRVVRRAVTVETDKISHRTVLRAISTSFLCRLKYFSVVNFVQILNPLFLRGAKIIKGLLIYKFDHVTLTTPILETARK